jgi:malonyl-CoA O-methyltransferase
MGKTEKVSSPPMLDKSVVRRHFQRAAATYDAAALVSREAGERMFSRLDYLKVQPQRIVDLGSGTGYFSQKLAEHYQQAHLFQIDFAQAMLQRARNRLSKWRRWLPNQRQHYMCADMAALPLPSQSIDMIWSNFALSWQERPNTILAECQRVLKPNGLLIFCTLGPDTLKELRSAFSAVDTYPHVHQFIDMHDLGDALIHHGLSDPVMDMEYITVTYNDVTTLLQDLKTTGANNALISRPQGLMGKQAWQAMLSQYEVLRCNGTLPATYEVIYGHAWKASTSSQSAIQPITFYPKNPQ